MSQLNIGFDTQTKIKSSPSAQIAISNLPEQIDLKETIDNFQRQLINERLKLRNGNLAATARDLNLNRSNFYRLLQRLGIKSAL